MCKQSQAFLNLFLAIIEENGYYEKLRKFMAKRGYNYADMASMLNNEYDECPDGMSVYYYMDSLEEMLENHEEENFTDIAEMVEYCYDHFLWKV